MICSRLCRLLSPHLCAVIFFGVILIGLNPSLASGSPAYFVGAEVTAAAAQTPPQNPPAPKPQQPPPQNPTPPTPFETVPQGQEAPKPPTPQQGVEEAKTVAIGENVVEEVQFRGQKRVPQDTLRALIYTKKGDPYDEESLHRDFMALWNTGRFDDLKLEKERGPLGGVIIRFVVVERRVVRSIDYEGNKSISKSEILDRFKERKVSLTPESQFDMGKVQRAKNVLLEYEAERGRQYATVTPDIRQVPPSSVEIIFKIDEGPKVKVGKIIIQGNKAFSNRQVIRAMKNLKPIGIPHSLLFEDLFARTYDSTKLEEDGERIRQEYQKAGYFKAHVISHSVNIHDVGGTGWRVPHL